MSEFWSDRWRKEKEAYAPILNDLRSEQRNDDDDDKFGIALKYNFFEWLEIFRQVHQRKTLHPSRDEILYKIS